jgi:ethanolamine utilization protein EutA (predicted chaperonin)
MYTTTATTRIFDVTIGDGHSYQVKVDDAGKVIDTACKGRWQFCGVATGSEWLDRKLQAAADEVLANA